MNFPLHLASPYYRPSWQGGDTYRPRCYRGPGIPDSLVTREPGKITCPTCLALHRGQPIPMRSQKPIRLEPLRALAPLRRRRSLEEIADLTCERWEVDLPAMMGRNKRGYLVEARQEAMWLMRSVGFSYAEIGRFMGDRHWATVIHGERRHAGRLAGVRRAA